MNPTLIVILTLIIGRRDRGNSDQPTLMTDPNDCLGKAGWTARLCCWRNRGGVAASKPWPEVLIVDVETLVANVGYDFKLEHLRSAV